MLVQKFPVVIYVGFTVFGIIILIVLVIMCRLLEGRKLLDRIINKFSQPLYSGKERGRVSMIGLESERKSLSYSKINENSELLDEEMTNSYSSLIQSRRSTVCSDILKIDKNKIGLQNAPIDILRRQSIYEVEEDVGKGSDCKMGCIRAIIDYDNLKYTLSVNIIEVQTISFQDKDDEYNIYVELVLHPGIHDTQQTQMCLKSKNTIFNEEIMFEEISERRLKYTSLNMKLFSVHDVHDKQFAGEIDFPLEFLLKNSGMAAIDRYFSPEKYNKSIGIIFLTLQLNMGKSKIIVTIRKGQNINTKESKQLPNPYCIIKYLNSDSKCVIRRTAIKYKSCSPEWNEHFNFYLPEENDLRKSDLKIKVFHKNGKGKVRIGRIDFPFIPGSSSHIQWEMMINNPGEPISEWHALQPSKS